MWETWLWSLGQEDPLEKEMATHSSILAWRIPWMEEPGRLQSMGSQRVGHDWVTSLSLSKLGLYQPLPWFSDELSSAQVTLWILIYPQLKTSPVMLLGRHWLQKDTQCSYLLQEINPSPDLWLGMSFDSTPTKGEPSFRVTRLTLLSFWAGPRSEWAPETNFSIFPTSPESHAGA